MDNLTHSLAGWVLAETGLKHRTRKGLAALVLAANMPDIDVFLGWVPWVPLATHRGFTHGLLGGVMIMPAMLAALLWLFDRWQLARGELPERRLPMNFGWLVVLCYLGAVTHPLLDWQNVYATQLLSPWNARWYHNDALFIIDAWVLLALGLGIGLSRRSERRGARAGRPAFAAIAVVLAYIAGNGALSGLARAAPAAGPLYGNPDSVFAAPPPLAFWRRDVVWREDGAIRRGRYDPFASLTTLRPMPGARPDNLGDPAVRRAMVASADVRTFLRWSVMTIATVERNGCVATVVFGDGRFTDARTRSSFTHEARVSDPRCDQPGSGADASAAARAGR